MMDKKDFDTFLDFYSKTSSLYTALDMLLKVDEKGSDFVASAKRYLLAEEKETGVNWQDLFAGRWLEHRSSSDK